MSRAEGFASIPTWMIRDAEISVHALTVYASLSSRSGLREIIPGRELLAKEARCSVRQVARALTELEELGVIRRVRRKGAAGRAPNGYTLHPNGLVPVEDSLSLTSEVGDRSDAGKGHSGQGYGTEGASRTSYRGRDSEAEREEVESASTELTLIPEISFDSFWSVWPKKVAKPDAQRAWDKAVKTTAPELIVDGAIAYRDNPGIPDKQFIPYPATWLNRQGWNDELPVRSGRDVAPMQRAAETLDIASRLQDAAERRAVGA